MSTLVKPQSVGMEPSTSGEDLARGIYFCQIIVAEGFEPEYVILKLCTDALSKWQSTYRELDSRPVPDVDSFLEDIMLMTKQIAKWAFQRKCPKLLCGLMTTFLSYPSGCRPAQLCRSGCHATLTALVPRCTLNRFRRGIHSYCR